MIKKCFFVIAVMLFLSGCSLLSTQEAVENESKTLENSDAMMESVRENGEEMEKEDGEMMGGESMDEGVGGEAMESDQEAMMMEEGESYSLAEVAVHGEADDCWIAIEGKVYDVTEYIDGGNHPGGAAILQGCGTDATELYNDRPNGLGAHSDQARSFLLNFYIGELEE